MENTVGWSNSRKQTKNVPHVVSVYRKHMGYVDCYNRAINYLSTKRGSKSGGNPFFFYFLDCALVNSWVLYKSQGNKITQFQFRCMVADSLLGDTVLRKRSANSAIGESLLDLITRSKPSGRKDGVNVAQLASPRQNLSAWSARIALVSLRSTTLNTFNPRGWESNKINV